MNKVGFLGLGINLFRINPVAVTLFSKDIYWYGIIIAAGFVTAIAVCSYLADKGGIERDNIYDIVLWATPVAIVCARIYYVAFNFSEYKDNLINVFKIWEGGIAIYGGIIGAVAMAYAYCKTKKIDVAKTFDVCCIGLVIGQIIGRWGNFVNVEAYGSETTLPWRMAILKTGMIKMIEVHPTFLYESLWNLVLLIFLIVILFKKKFDGQVFGTYIFGYGLGRALIEGLRTDSLYIGIFRVSQVLAIITSLLALIYLVVNLSKCRKNCNFKSKN